MKVQGFLSAVTAAGLLVIGHCISSLLAAPLDAQWLVLAVLTLLTGAFTIKLPSITARLSVSDTFVFASVLLFGTCAGTITVAVEILVIIAAGVRSTREPSRILFNVSAAALSIWIAGLAFFSTSGIEPLSKTPASLGPHLVPLALLAITYFLLNSGLVATAVAITRGESPLRLWRTNFLPLSVNYLGGASVAALFVSYTKNIDLVAFAVIVPLLVISHLTFKHSFSRIEAATRHIEDMRRLYLSTIETLATAIDAKDQITHGHIRRVQQLALALADKLGLRDPSQIQALEAAALLHDTGKLAIPEHILNKPGRLSDGELARMREHARVGAEILSSIRFPYPVVPIVRHHHENWDGSGYPDGLKGTDIPIGARILAVADCYDALTSDRPYRRRMSEEEAISIILERRGTMYDPLIVDTFLANLRELRHALAGRIDSPVGPVSLQHVSHRPVQSFIQHERQIAALLEAATACTSAHLAIWFAIDDARDELVSLVAQHHQRTGIPVIRIPVGHGVVGWVSVNGKAVLNADPWLDLPKIPLFSSLRSNVCVPLPAKEPPFGVIAVYSERENSFAHADLRSLENIARQIADQSSREVILTLISNVTTRDPAPTIH